MIRPITLFLVLTASAAMNLAASAPAAAQYTCESVARRGDTDPGGALFSNRFRPGAGVNQNGDVVFVARPIGLKDQLYLYENGGAQTTLAVGGGPAVLPGATFTARPFEHTSINDGGDVAFWGNLVSQGEAVYGQPSGGALGAIAATTQGTPAGGVYDEFPVVAEINAGGRVTFLATTIGGPSTAVFSDDVAGGSPATEVMVGDTTTSGREICEILDVDAGDGGQIVILAETKVSCANLGESALDTVVHVSGGTNTEVAKVMDATPIGGTTYASFKLTPQVNASGDVIFETKLSGAISSQAVFEWNGAVLSPPVVLQGDFSPEANGSYRKISDIGYANTGESFVKAKFKGAGAKDAVIRLDPPAPSVGVITKDDTVPNPPYGGAAFYRKMGKFISVAHDGSHVTLVPKIKDSILPKSKVGVILCVE